MKRAKRHDGLNPTVGSDNGSLAAMSTKNIESISYSKRNHSTTLLIQLGLGACVLLSGASANAASCHFYQVNIQGNVTSNYGSQPFSVNQYAMWRDAGVTSHPIEFVFTTFQDLNASAQVGQIELMTNSAFARNAGIASARFDLATVSVSNVVSFQMDSGMSFQLPPPNVFVATGVGSSPGGLGGLGFLTGAGGELAQFINSAPVLSFSYLIPRNGWGYFYLPDGNSIAGQLDVIGTPPDNTSLQGQYTASFSGTHVGSAACD